MADQELAPVEELEPVDAPAEDQVAPVEEASTDDPVAKLASEMGWAPKELYRGPPEDWKPADEFIRAGRDITRAVSKKLKTVEETLENVSRTSATLLEQQLAERDAYWANKKREAIDAGDYEAVEHADQKRAEIKQQLPAQTAQSLPPEAQAFVEKHSSWFNKDTEATAYATNRAEFYAKQGLSPARQLAAVEQDMKGVFPDLFPAPAKPAPTVARPASRTATTSSRTKSFHDLPAEAQAVARDMHDRLGIPLETYVTNYFNQRKVG